MKIRIIYLLNKMNYQFYRNYRCDDGGYEA